MDISGSYNAEDFKKYKNINNYVFIDMGDSTCGLENRLYPAFKRVD